MSDNARWKQTATTDQLESWAASLLADLQAFASAADVPDRASLLRRLVGLRTDDMRRFVKHERMEPWASMPMLTFCFVMHHVRVIRRSFIPQHTSHLP